MKSSNLVPTIAALLAAVACGSSQGSDSSNSSSSSSAAGRSGSGGSAPSSSSATNAGSGGSTSSQAGQSGGAGPGASGGSGPGSSGGSSASAPGSGGTTSSGSGGGSAAPSASGYLHVEGSELRDDSGNLARFTGVNWFGFETSNLSPHGLWARDYKSMLKQIKALGFNAIRLPFCDKIFESDAAAQSVNTYGADPYDQTDPMNGDLEGKTPLEMLDAVVAAAKDLGLKLILDNHSRAPDGYMEEEVWYTDSVSESQWIANWVALAKRYKGNTAVLAVDLDNEPHGKATWGAGDATTDWNSAAERCGNAILEVNPDVLIIVEGVEKVGTDGYWWGGNLSGVKKAPISLSNPKKLVYSAHEYGPEVHLQDWFTSSSFPSNLPSIWDAHFAFLMNEKSGHVFIGEFGVKDRTANDGKAGVWFDTVLSKLGSTYSWTFWCWNPNSGDTEGILDYDWLTPKQWKVDALTPYLAPMIAN